MNGDPKMADYSSRDTLYTNSLGGCNVALLITPKMAFGVHVSRGTLIPGTTTYAPGYTPLEMATRAAESLVALYNQNRAAAGTPVKGLVITPVESYQSVLPNTPPGDDVAVAMFNVLGRVAPTVWNTYGAMAAIQRGGGVLAAFRSATAGQHADVHFDNLGCYNY
jgi:hypothetical protein